MATPYMNLSLPVVGTTQGPAWASAINAAFSAVDAHDHSPGKGVPVSTSGLYVDAGLAFGNFDATGLRSARFTNHAAPLAGSADLGCLFVSAGELYFRDGAGNAIQFSAGGALNAASVGAIGGDYSTSTASLSYASVSTLFSFESVAGTKAHAALGNLTIHEAVASGKGVTLRAPTGLAANYQLVLPAALPASTKILTLASTGAISAVYDVDGSTLEVASNALRVKDSGVGNAKIADLAVSTSKLADTAVTTAKIGDAEVTSPKLAAHLSALGADGSSNACSMLLDFYASVTWTSAGGGFFVFSSADRRIRTGRTAPTIAKQGTNVARISHASITGNSIAMVTGPIGSVMVTHPFVLGGGAGYIDITTYESVTGSATHAPFRVWIWF